MKRPHTQSHVTLQSCSHVTIQKRHISSTTRPMTPNFAGLLRGRNAQSQMTLLKQVISPLSHGLCSVVLAKDEKILLKNLQFT